MKAEEKDGWFYSHWKQNEEMEKSETGSQKSQRKFTDVKLYQHL